MQGSVTSIEKGAVKGWVWDPERPYTPLSVDILYRGTLLVSKRADLFEPVLAERGMGDGRHAFMISLPEAVADTRMLEVRVREGGAILSSQAVSQPTVAWEGRFDGVDAGQVNGWARFAEDTHRKPMIDIWVDGEKVTSTRADQWRGDLEQAKGDGRCSFNTRLPRTFFDGREHTVDVRIAGAGLSLPGAPRRYVLQPNGQAAVVTKNEITSKPAALVATPKILASAQATGCQGTIERVQHGALRGWAFHPDHAKSRVKLELLVDGKPACETLADIPRGDLKGKIGDGSHGFLFLIPVKYLDGREHTLDVRVAETKLSLKKSPQRVRLTKGDEWYEGALDRAVYPMVQGWARNRHRDDTPVEVEILLGDTPVMTVLADQVRADLVRAKKGDGRKGFTAQLPVAMSPGDKRQVSARIKGTDFLLSGSPMTLETPKSNSVYRPHILYRAPDSDRLLPDASINIVSTRLLLKALMDARAPTILIPIYNAYDEVKRCLDSVIRNTTRPAELLLINDASTDKRIASLLKSYASLPGVTVLKNLKNLGFTRTVNKGLARVKGDVVLLNSDTEVTPRWLEKLMITAYRDPAIATVTAVSNRAGAFSIPEEGENDFPDALSHDALGRFISSVSRRLAPETPTGNGFCLFIRKSALDAVGLLDEKNFPRGYGEENDFCMRAMALGYRHVVDDSTLIFHARSASFGKEKERLLTEGASRLHAKHPHYAGLVREFISSARVHEMREPFREAFAWLKAQKPKQLQAIGRPHVLTVLHGNATGGTPQTNEDMMSALSGHYETFWLDCDTEAVRLRRFENGKYEELGYWLLPRRLSLLEEQRDDYRAVLAEILVRHSIELVHIRHLYKHTFDLPEVAHALGIPVIQSFHDFYYVCPTINLLDEKGTYCAGKCTPGEGACPMPMHEPGMPTLKHHWVYRWRERAERMFAHTDAFVTTSQDAKQVHIAAFPSLKKRAFEVIEHGRDFKKQYHCAEAPKAGQKVKILIPGQLTPHKGADFIEALLALDSAARLEFHFLGNLPPRYRHLGHWHGTYARDEFPERVKEVSPHFIGIFSVWAETYCHSLSEAWACGVPVIASHLGALGERIQAHGGGWCVDITKPDAAYRQILALADTSGEHEKAAKQASLSNLRTTQEMGEDYAALYANVFKSHHAFEAQAKAKKGKKKRS